MQGNILGQNTNGVQGLKIYQQTTEPTRKEGIWVKTTDKIKDVQACNGNDVEVTIIGTVSEVHFSQDGSFEYGAMVTIDNIIYFIGGDLGGEILSFNTFDNTFKKLEKKNPHSIAPMRSCSDR